MAAERAEIQLPMQVATRSDVGQLRRELDTVDNFLTQAAIRQPGTSVQLPKTSRLFDDVVSINKLNMLQQNDRQLLMEFFQLLHDKAPVLHVSFGSDPSPLFVQKLITWLRQQIHPYVLLQIGLQPTIGAGCALRTTNKYFDFSLRERFNQKRGYLVAQLHSALNAQPASAETQAEITK